MTASLQEAARKWGFGTYSTQTNALSFRSQDSDHADNVFEKYVTASRNRKIFSSLPEFVALLAELGVEGPEEYREWNIETRGMPIIGEGNQFTVFRGDTQDKNVIKRVKISRHALTQEPDPMLNDAYRQQWRTLELEILILSRPKIRNHRNIVRLLSWGCK